MTSKFLQMEYVLFIEREANVQVEVEREANTQIEVEREANTQIKNK
ncbi:hypothetical protein KSZ_44930 [Dictyobacter formicarum]|uniref:Uncharacterized protein n=1 Tax=Dictyobacter formicarum TaxID=2778368 RepID=A0ABQ3VJU3_9CHLR|nr:hypothetical protein KSZ_44930 [Dictyobacter formicarum]